LKRWKISHNIL